ncbi:MAG: 4'-phosphopantetheinyl transferase superfamily protein [Acidobacteriia bacterium]|nr:4'-phosphopantetheinyl transferase superfamily protein [Terriglobia bacterium]
MYGPKGKPALVTPAGVSFNTSHSGGLAVFAFTPGCELGVDLERIRPLPDLQDVAQRFFCSEETSDLLALPAGQQERAFFLCWTRKEAYIKATGDGLSVPLDAFRVELRPGEAARFIHVAHDVKAAKAWTLHDLDFGPDYAAALAYQDAERPLTVFRPADPADLLAMP